MTSNLRGDIDLNQQINSYKNKLENEKKHGVKILHREVENLRDSLVSYKSKEHELMQHNKTMECLLEAVNKNSNILDNSYNKYELAFFLSLEGSVVGLGMSMFFNAISRFACNEKQCCTSDLFIVTPIIFGAIQGWRIGIDLYDHLTEIELFRGSASDCFYVIES
jgi:hypothetical protein